MTWLSSAYVDPSVHELFPDYRASLIVADHLQPGPSDEVSGKLLADAEARYQGEDAVEWDGHPHLAAWRAAFRALGAKPQRFRPSVDALLRRVPAGLPRINRLTDVYNAVSIAHVLPIGGEDVTAYRGPLRLVRATGEEEFDTVAAGEPATEHPEPGEIVWRDDLGITCRRWNWRQCVRTRLTEETTHGVFILDALGAMPDADLAAATAAMVDVLRATSPDADITTRTLNEAD
ncbi:MAG TPA: phenylalanine--tRNA ligase beta subunit-related protein [Pseudonocardia sp.]|nr:phenylalanine--tRNA ligase beta subunit-related protein [Pseudonocardia sp.]